MHVHASRDRILIGRAAELETSPRTVVQLGAAPDGLPWLLRVDRSHELSTLFSVVPQVFGVAEAKDLPPRVLHALEHDVAAGLMGVHDVTIDAGARRGFVSRKKLKHLLGPTLFAQLLDAPAAPTAAESYDSPITNVGAMASRDQNEALLDAVDHSIEALRAKRHLLVDLATGQPYSCSVRDTDRALRTPTAPLTPLALESLAAFGDVEVLLLSGVGSWHAALADATGVHNALLRLHQNPSGGSLRYSISRQHVLAQLVGVARAVDQLHRRERVHGDLAPGNVLVCADGARAFDGLDIEAGTPATAATFEWAAPEQIVGHPVDPRTDVYALGRMATAILGGVIFGEQTDYVVPIGGDRSRHVKLLKAEGVFLDITDKSLDRAWQRAWQELVGRAVSYDRTRRHPTAGQFADDLAGVLEKYAVPSRVELEPAFGDVVPITSGATITFAHLAVD